MVTLMKTLYYCERDSYNIANAKELGDCPIIARSNNVAIKTTISVFPRS